MNEYELLKTIDFSTGEKLLNRYVGDAIDVLTRKAPQDIVRIVLWYDDENFDVSLRCATRIELTLLENNASELERDHLLYSSDEWSQDWYWDNEIGYLKSSQDWRAWHNHGKQITSDLLDSESFENFDSLSGLSHQWFRAICISALNENRKTIEASSKTADDIVYYIQPHDSPALEFKLDLAQTIGVQKALALGL